MYLSVRTQLFRYCVYFKTAAQTEPREMLHVVRRAYFKPVKNVYDTLAVTHFAYPVTTEQDELENG